MVNIINRCCPYSGKPVSTEAVTTYKGFTVGFCSIMHRDQFDQRTNGFSSAIKYFDILIKEKNLMPLNQYCPQTGKAISPEITAEYKDMKVGFCCTKHRDNFIRHPESSSHIAAYFDVLIKEKPLAELTPILDANDLDAKHLSEPHQDSRESVSNISLPDAPTFEQ